MNQKAHVNPKDKKPTQFDKKDLVVVRINQTNVETVVCRDYQKKYSNSGVVYLRDYDPVAEGDAKAKLSYEELKKALTEKGVEFKGNAPKEELERLLEGV